MTCRSAHLDNRAPSGQADDVGRPWLYWVTVFVGAVAGFVVFALAPGPRGGRFVPAAHFVLLLVSSAVLFKSLLFKTVTRLRDDYSTERGRQ